MVVDRRVDPDAGIPSDGDAKLLQHHGDYRPGVEAIMRSDERDVEPLRAGEVDSESAFRAGAVALAQESNQFAGILERGFEVVPVDVPNEPAARRGATVPSRGIVRANVFAVLGTRVLVDRRVGFPVVEGVRQFVFVVCAVKRFGLDDTALGSKRTECKPADEIGRRVVVRAERGERFGGVHWLPSSFLSSRGTANGFAGAGVVELVVGASGGGHGLKRWTSLLVPYWVVVFSVTRQRQKTSSPKGGYSSRSLADVVKPSGARAAFARFIPSPWRVSQRQRVWPAC